VNKIAIFGGSFDPPHLAHRELLTEVQSEYNFQKIWIVPSHFPPQKTPTASFEERLRWCKKIFDGAPFEVSEFESESTQTIFGIDIFTHLSLKAPDADYYWILGEDQWKQLSYWKAIDYYGFRLHWIILPRELNKKMEEKGLLSRRLQQSTAAYRVAKADPKPHISSTEIRMALSGKKTEADRKEILRWIPKSIAEEVLTTYQTAKGA
jgi:nicotinate (nicotinamide) nucleotide adenylyltransferase